MLSRRKAATMSTHLSGKIAALTLCERCCVVGGDGASDGGDGRSGSRCCWWWWGVWEGTASVEASAVRVSALVGVVCGTLGMTSIIVCCVVGGDGDGGVGRSGSQCCWWWWGVKKGTASVPRSMATSSATLPESGAGARTVWSRCCCCCLLRARFCCSPSASVL